MAVFDQGKRKAWFSHFRSTVQVTMKSLVFFVLILVSLQVVEGQGYRSGSGYIGGNYAGGGGRYTQGNRCPRQACTLQLIPPECRQRQVFVYSGRMCPGCDIDICSGVNTGVQSQLPNGFQSLGF
uniref:Uncharacterized protein LOC111124024 n=1 Tax=Crassostrea virginica TaxID=6565 RepID=A0A8B8D4G9_CRAVI|nr:uncharacterized protein LOC111124024 [Crassostrea virginica]